MSALLLALSSVVSFSSRDILAVGVPGQTTPFGFGAGTKLTQAQGAGLEGYAWTEQLLARRYPADRLAVAHAAIAPYTAPFVPGIETPRQLRAKVQELQTQIKAPSDWIRSARIYEVLPRAFDPTSFAARFGPGIPLHGQQELFTRFIEGGNSWLRAFARVIPIIKGSGFDTVWLQELWPMDGWGDDDGSPYSVRDYGSINPRLGTEEELRELITLARYIGVSFMADLIPNHVAYDSSLVSERPEIFRRTSSTTATGECPADHFVVKDRDDRERWIQHGGYTEVDGSRVVWEKTAQIDHASDHGRGFVTEVALRLVDLGFEAIRVDMGYRMPDGLLGYVIDAVRAVKPRVGFLGECCNDAHRERLSAEGFDVLYFKPWFDSMRRRQGSHAQAAKAIDRAGFLAWQRGIASSCVYVTHHDEAALRRDFKDIERQVSYLTLLHPGAMIWYGGQEVLHDAGENAGDMLDDRRKAIPFGAHRDAVRINWGKSPEFAAFFKNACNTANHIRALYGPGCRAEPLPVRGGHKPDPAAGYYLVNAAGTRAAAVLVNFDNENDVTLVLEDKTLGVLQQVYLKPGQCRFVEFELSPS